MNRPKLKRRREGTGGSGCSITPQSEGSGVDKKNDEKQEMNGKVRRQKGHGKSALSIKFV